jgi:acetate---CoA ligase (ADP-forming)
MEFFFKPGGIAVVGATPSEGKGGNIIVSNLLKGYTGAIYPVNSRYEEINGLKCYASILDVPDPVDLAIVYVGATMVPQIVEDCAKRGVPGVMLQSAGFSESGPEGAALQAETARIAERTGIRLWGPNCMGLVDAVNRNVFSTVAPVIWSAGLTPGNVSLIVQSGMLAGAFLIDIMTHGATGISKACSIGNKMDVNESDILEYLLNDPDTGAIGLYLESIVDGPRFISLCRGATKPIVVLKGGKSTKGAEAALSHTASLAGNDAVVSGALRQAGVVEAMDFYQMMDFCRVLGAFPHLLARQGNRVAIMTYSGGAGIVSTDFLDGLGLELAELSKGSIEILQPLYPDWMLPANPMDLWPGIISNGTIPVYNKALEAVCSDPGVDGIFVHCFVGGFALEPDLPFMARLAREAGKPLIIWISGERQAVHHFQIQARELNVPVFREVYRAVECLGAVLGRNRTKVSARQVEPEKKRLPEKIVALLSDSYGSLDEYDSKKILAAMDIPVAKEQLTDSVEEACKAAQFFGFPVVLKGVARDMIHKTEAGLVRLNISSAQQVKIVFAELMTAMNNQGRVLVQAQIPDGLEIIVGLVRDPQFGPCVMCGLGGIMAELLQDRVFAVAPVSHEDALALIGRLKSQPLLDGFRGAKALERHALARVLVQVSQLAVLYPEISQIDINPLIINEGLPVSVDATIILKKQKINCIIQC